MTACPACGVQLTARPKFCPECGTKLDAPPSAAESRRVVTILFSDVTGSTALGEQLDPEAVRTLMGRYFAAMKTVIERHGGTVEKFIGDAIMAVFGIPVLHEDDALRAVRAAAQMREALAALNEELSTERAVAIQTRTGITTGEVVAGDPSAGQTLVTGDTINTAARLEQAADPGEILIGEPTWRLVRDAVTAEPIEPIAAKGKAMPVPAFRLASVSAGAEGNLRRMGAPMVGRERELTRLQQAYDNVIAHRSPQLFTLLGTAGVGKSRLIREFALGVAAESRVLRGRCLPYGEGITYWPVAEALREAAAIDESMDRSAASSALLELVQPMANAETVAENLASAIGMSEHAASQDEVFGAVRRAFEYLSEERPLVIIWEDIHWAEPVFLDLIDHLADSLRDAPVLILCPARPELVDQRRAWGGGKLNATTVLLESLPAADAERLIDTLPGGRGMPESIKRRIAEVAEGNPLFLEELFGMLVDDGLVNPISGEWLATADLGRLEVPHSISALLAARLERLAPAERDVIQRAAVVGRTFEADAVAGLAPPSDEISVPEVLMALVRKELIRQERSALSAGDTYRFRHVLIRDAAYEALPKAERAVLHERAADQLEAAAGDRVSEVDEIVAYHLEQAFHYLRDLGQSAERHQPLARRAASRYASAGERAFQRDDPAAVTLLERARALAPHQPDVLDRLPFLSIALGNTAEPERMREVANEVVEHGRAIGDDRLIALGEVRLAEEMEMSPSSEAVARRAITVLERCGDQRGAARAWNLLESHLSSTGRAAEALAAAENAASRASAVDDRREYARSLHGVMTSLVGGPTHVAQALHRAEAIVSDRTLQPTFYALCLATHTLLLASAGKTSETRAVQAEVDALVERTNAPEFTRLLCALFMTEADLAMDDSGSAERRLRSVEQIASKYNDMADIVQGTIGDALLLGGRDAEALAIARQLISSASTTRSRDRDAGVEARLHRLAAEALSRHGDHRSAAGHIVAAAAAIVETEWLPLKANVALTRAFVLHRSGNDSESGRFAREALSLYRAKGHEPGIAKTEAFLNARPST